ncbi:MAG: YdbL family protein [Deltaproteobacteria bacterium]|nr:YdbL family protein [Deltaproteobacteria bacterium]
MEQLKQLLAAFIFFFAVLTIQPAYALSIDEAKAQGLVGETTTGYLAAVKQDASLEVATLVKEINNQRRREYAQIAQKNRTAVAAVEKLAGEKAIQRSPAGTFVQKPDGSWVKK